MRTKKTKTLPLFYSQYRQNWAPMSSRAICVPVCPCTGGYALTFPPSTYTPLLPSDPTSPVSSSPDHWVGTPPLNPGRAAASPTISAQQLRLCLSSCSPLPAPCSAETSLPASHPHTTLACKTTLHSHLLSTHIPAPHSHLNFGYRQPVPGAPLGLVSAAAKDRVTLHIPSRLGKVYKRALVVPPSSLLQRMFVCGACTGTAQVGISLVSLFDPLFKRSRLHCFDI